MYVILSVPITIGFVAELLINPYEALTVPLITKQKSPFFNSPTGLLSASVARVNTHGADTDPTVVNV